MNKKNPKVDAFISRAEQWKKEYKKLRSIIRDCGLTEELKWGVPCYTLGNKNIILMHGFKEYCAVLFPKGALLKDPEGILITQTENVQAARQVRFTNVLDIARLETALKAYIYEAIEAEKAGRKVAHRQTTEYPVPEEFVNKLEQNPELQTAFDSLTPGRQRAYLLYFAAPKQSKTREARVEKSAPRILRGMGLND